RRSSDLRDCFEATAIAAATARTARPDDYVTNLASARRGAAIQRAVDDQAAADASSDEYAKHIASATCGSAFEFAIDTGVHVILDDRRAAELLSRARAQRK